MKTKRIYNLTKEQELLIEQYREECYLKGISLEPINREILEKAITELYSIHELKKPTFYYGDSIYHCQLIMNALEKNLSVNQLDQLDKNNIKYFDSYLWGQYEYYWIAFYIFPEKYLGIKYDDIISRKLHLFETIADYGHFWWAFEDVCVLSERPVQLNLNIERKLHNEDGPAILYKDGFSFFAINGEVIMNADKINEIDNYGKLYDIIGDNLMR